jgi:hypothetical protein
MNNCWRSWKGETPTPYGNSTKCKEQHKKFTKLSREYYKTPEYKKYSTLSKKYYNMYNDNNKKYIKTNTKKCNKNKLIRKRLNCSKYKISHDYYSTKKSKHLLNKAWEYERKIKGKLHRFRYGE